MKTKRGKLMGRPRVNPTTLHVSVPEMDMSEIQRWIDQQPDRPSKPRALLRLALIGLAAERPAKGKRK